MLNAARDQGFVGPGLAEAHVSHALGFAEAIERFGAEPRVVDLGSGAGLPGLVIALERPDVQVMLVDANAKRGAFMETALGELGLDGRVQVKVERAESLGRDPEARGRAAAVVARSFGPPGVVAECAAPLLEVGGRLIVSDPPGANPSRWPGEKLAELGLATAVPVVSSAGHHFAVMEQVRPCSDRYPRRDGVPAKRPLF